MSETRERGGRVPGAPTAATSARLAGARWFPTSESTFKARVTSTGARNSRLVLMYASVYSEMKPHPARCAPAAVRYFKRVTEVPSCRFTLKKSSG